MSFRSPLGRSRGLGPAKEAATSHWFAERLPAIGLIPLMLWFVFCAAIPHIQAPWTDFVAFMRDPINASLMMLITLFGFYHGLQGLLVIVGDYVGVTWLRNVIVIALKLYAACGAAFAALAIIKLYIGG